MRRQARYLLLYVSLLPFRLVCRMFGVPLLISVTPAKTDIEGGRS